MRGLRVEPTARREKNFVKLAEIYSRVGKRAPGFLKAGDKRRVLLDRPGDFILLAIWFGLVTGLAEVAYLGASKFFLHKYLHIGFDVVWMTPLAEALLFAVPGLMMYLLASLRPGLAKLRLAVFLYTFLGCLALLLMISSLLPLAAVVLAAGIAVQAARVADSHPSAFYKLLSYTTGWTRLSKGASQQRTESRPAEKTTPDYRLNRREFLVTAGTTIVGLAVGVQGWKVLGERRTLGQLPAPLSGAPNVLFIVLDTVRAASLSLYGYARRTSPNLERLAKEGILFERAFSPAPWTLPSHSSIFTGRYPHELSADWEKPLDGAYPTLAGVLSAHGYEAAGFVANTAYCAYESGLARGFAHYADYLVTPGLVLESSSLVGSVTGGGNLPRFLHNYDSLGSRRIAPKVADEFLNWLDHREKRPFFAFLNFHDAHEPYYAPAPFDSMFGSTTQRNNILFDSDPRVPDVPPQLLQAEMNAYDSSIAYLDHHLGLLFDELGKRSVLDDTLVIVTSDHGEEFGEHDLFRHGKSLYLPSLHVPLIISFASHLPVGKTVRHPVSLRDLYATVLELVGVNGQNLVTGDSLARYWSDQYERNDAGMLPLLAETNVYAGLPKWVPVSKGNMKSLLLGEYHYIRNGDNREELYNWEADPWEQQDLAQTEGGLRELMQFRESLAALLTRS